MSGATEQAALPDGNADPTLRALLQAHRVKAGSEVEEIVARWLQRELAHCPDTPAALGEAVQIALTVYNAFQDTFAHVFQGEECKGVELVRRTIRSHYGFVTQGMVEAVVDRRILDRRLELLDACRTKYQPTLFGPRTFDPKQVRGFLVRVARIESLHVPKDALPGQLAATDPATLGASPPPADTDNQHWSYLLDLLDELWSPANGFTWPQRIEGLVSIGAGERTGDTDLRERCARLLEENWSAWERQRQLLRRLASQLTQRFEATRKRRNTTNDLTERAELDRRLDELDQRLQRVEQRLAGYHARLWPRPGQVKEMLTGKVASPSNVRKRRIDREVILLHARVTASRAELSRVLPAAVPEAIRRLSNEIVEHLASVPPSPGIHKYHGQKVSPEARRQLRQAHSRWLAAGRDFLAQARAQLRSLFHAPRQPAIRWPLQGFLADVEDLLELGVLSHRGILGGLGHRSGWRLEWLLSNDRP
ncbi:MAG TPA: hypothetical protein VEL76_09700 [Gemmataceae bacterium]|nr:hypothetical protein [Gemmataceae bacterium]